MVALGECRMTVRARGGARRRSVGRPRHRRLLGVMHSYALPRRRHSSTLPPCRAPSVPKPNIFGVVLWSWRAATVRLDLPIVSGSHRFQAAWGYFARRCSIFCTPIHPSAYQSWDNYAADALQPTYSLIVIRAAFTPAFAIHASRSESMVDVGTYPYSTSNKRTSLHNICSQIISILTKILSELCSLNISK